MAYLHFSVVDYALFISMVSLSVLVGLYFGLCRKPTSVVDYLQAGKQMKVFPVTMSMLASTLSGLTLVSTPSEIYLHGIEYMMKIIGFPLIGFVINLVYLPVFFKLQLVSIFEYCELRFDKRVRVLTSIIFVFTNLVTIPMIIYVPALSFSYVTGSNVYINVIVIILICVSYTTIGGARAIIWSDTLQISVTLCTLGYALIMGIIKVGGLSFVWEKAKQGERLNFFNMDPYPTSRSNFWSVLVGNFFLWTLYIGVFPSSVYRFLSVPTIKDAKIVLATTMLFLILSKIIICFSGLIMYSKYFDCDPLSAGYIKKADQIMPHYILDVASEIPGLSGLFVSGLVNTALSTMSTFLNALSGNIYGDFVSPFLTADRSEKWAGTIMKIITLVIALLCIPAILVFERLGPILELTYSLLGMTNGPLLGIFTLGMLFPMASRKGAFYGTIISSLFMAYIIIQNQMYVWKGSIRSIPKPLSIDGCNITSDHITLANSTSTLLNSNNNLMEEPFWLFRISFHYYCLMGTLLTIISGLLISFFVKEKENFPVNLDLFSPCVHRYILKSNIGPVYQSTEMLTLVNGKKRQTKT